MKMKTRLLVPLLVLLLAACSEEESASDLNSSQASNELVGVASNMSSDIVTLTQSQGIDGASALIDLLENSNVLSRVAYSRNESLTYTTQQVSLVGQYFTFGVAALLQEDSELWDYKGRYVWDFELQDFENQDPNLDVLIVEFPIEESTTNNGIFSLTEVSFIEINGEEYPTSIQATLSVSEPGQDNVEVIDLDFSAQFGDDDSLDQADVSLDILPFSFELSFDDTQTTTASLGAALLLNGENITSINVTVQFDSEAKLEPISASGEVSYRTLRIVGSVSDDEMDASESSDPNDYIDLDLLIGADKAGDIIFIFEEVVDDDGFVFEDYVAYVQYADATTEKLEDILDPVFDEIDELVDDLE